MYINVSTIIVAFVCLFGGVSSHLRIFHIHVHVVDVTIAGEELQILTYSPHSWPLNTDVSLACHTYCDTGHMYKMVISEETPIAERLAVEMSLLVFTT